MRVSRRRRLAGLPASISSARVWTSTVLSGNLQPCGAPGASGYTNPSNSIFDSPGSAIKRSFRAPSSQLGALIEYGINPGAGMWSFAEAKSPVSLNRRGNVFVFGEAGFSTIR